MSRAFMALFAAGKTFVLSSSYYCGGQLRFSNL